MLFGGGFATTKEILFCWHTTWGLGLVALYSQNTVSPLGHTDIAIHRLGLQVRQAYFQHHGDREASGSNETRPEVSRSRYPSIRLKKNLGRMVPASA